jgi:hypothetical protein
MLLNRAFAAMCGGKLVFALPGPAPLVALAVDRLVVPQLDPRSEWATVATLLPRFTAYYRPRPSAPSLIDQAKSTKTELPARPWTAEIAVVPPPPPPTAIPFVARAAAAAAAAADSAPVPVAPGQALSSVADSAAPVAPFPLSPSSKFLAVETAAIAPKPSPVARTTPPLPRRVATPPPIPAFALVPLDDEADPLATVSGTIDEPRLESPVLPTLPTIEVVDGIAPVASPERRRRGSDDEATKITDVIGIVRGRLVGPARRRWRALLVGVLVLAVALGAVVRLAITRARHETAPARPQPVSGAAAHDQRSAPPAIPNAVGPGPIVPAAGVAAVDRTAPPSGSAASRAPVPAVDGTGPPSGSAAGRVPVPPVEPAAAPTAESVARVEHAARPVQTRPAETRAGVSEGSRTRAGSGSGENNQDDAQCGEQVCARTNNERECCAPYRAKTGNGTAPPSGGAAGRAPVPAGEQLPDALSKALVTAEIARIKPFVRTCSDRAPDTHGKVKVHLAVRRDGVVTAATVREAPSGPLGACVAEVLRTAKFPATQNGGAFTSGFEF